MCKVQPVPQSSKAKSTTTGFQRSLAVAMLLITVVSNCVGYPFRPILHTCYWTLFATLACLIRAGALIPCTLVGVLFGLASDSAVKGGTHISMMRETVSHLITGTVIGIVLGFVIDAIRQNRLGKPYFDDSGFGLRRAFWKD